MHFLQTPVLIYVCQSCNGYGVTPESMLTGLSFSELSELETQCPDCSGSGLIEQSEQMPKRMVLCQDCLKTAPYTDLRHNGDELCECGGDFCGCRVCNSLSQEQSGDLCRSPVQSPDVVGQGSTELKKVCRHRLNAPELGACPYCDDSKPRAINYRQVNWDWFDPSINNFIND